MKNKYSFTYKVSYEWISDEKSMKNFLDFIFNELKIVNSEISVAFVDENEIRNLNKVYRNLDEPTDVLSFESCEDDFIVGGHRLHYLGDIIICPSVCSDNSKRFNEEPYTELLRLILHGVLHLKGMDHATNNSDEPMLLYQETLLKNYLKHNKFEKKLLL